MVLTTARDVDRRARSRNGKSIGVIEASGVREAVLDTKTDRKHTCIQRKR